jgi:type IV pilus assembly protein PilC
MATFSYTGKDAAGRKVSGTIDANSAAEASDTLRRRRVDKVKVKASRTSGGFLKKAGKPKKGEVELFTRQLSTMVSAGIPLLECLEILQEQAESMPFKHGVKTVIGTFDPVRI